MKSIGWRVLVLLSFLVAMFLPDFVAHTEANQPPDIILIMTDDMRADDWRMLEDTQRLVGGTMFENFIFNTPLCCPTRAEVQRGEFAHNTGIKLNGDGADFPKLDNDTLATAVDAAGYHTIYVGKYMNSYDRQAPGWDAWDVMGQRGFDGNRYRWHDNYTTDVITEKVVQRVQEAPADQPLFLMIGHVAPHGPWNPAPEYKEDDVGEVINKDDADRKRTLLSVDDSTEEIAAAMGERWNNAVIVVMSDNGYLLGEHGTFSKSHWWDESQRVPMLYRGPGFQGGSDSRLVQTVDIPATLLDVAGASMKHPLEGIPISQIQGREGVLIESWAEESAGYKRTPYRGIKGDGWVYVEPRGQRPRYYTLPGEEDNLYEKPGPRTATGTLPLAGRTEGLQGRGVYPPPAPTPLRTPGGMGVQEEEASAMRIVQRKEVKDPRLGMKVCNRCGSIMDIEASDVPAMKRHAADPHDQRDRAWWSIACPVCGYEMSLGVDRGW